MNRQAVLILLVGVGVAPMSAWAAESTSGMKDMQKADTREKHSAIGVVKDVDLQTGQVTLDHGPVPSLNWPPMRTQFEVSNKTLLDKLKVGKKVTIEFVQRGSSYVVTSVK